MVVKPPHISIITFQLTISLLILCYSVYRGGLVDRAVNFQLLPRWSIVERAVNFYKHFESWKSRACALKKICLFKYGLMVVDSVRQGQLWYHGLKRAERESKHKVSSTVNRYVSCFINEHFVSFLVGSFLRNELAFPFQR